MLSPSTRVGRYEIKSALDKGGMGSLYIARDPNTDRLVAIKLLAAHLDSDELKARFDLEAKALAQLNHPNIVDIYDSGQYRGAPFIVMEFVRGETLDELIRRGAPLSPSRKLKLVAQLCAGLAHAHEAGVIHRDIKPANLMVEDRSQRLKIVDFGIARVTEGLSHYGKMTRVNTQIGTPGYMSPEQVEGGTLDHRSDLFAVGVVLYELLTNTTAFTGNSTRQIERKILEEQPPPINTVVPDCDPAIQAIVDKALQKDPANRFQSAQDFADALDAEHERLGKAESGERTRPTPAGAKASPAPAPKGSKADVAYQRSQDAYAEGATEAAKRFAVEALVEDPGHELARAFIKKVDPQRWVPPRPSPKRGTVPPTQVARKTGPAHTQLSGEDTDATLVTPRGLVSPRPPAGPGEESSGEWDPFARTVVVRPGNSSAAEPWADQGSSEGSQGFDSTLVVPASEESGTWPQTRSEADPYDRTIIAPVKGRKSGRKSAERSERARPGDTRKAFPWRMVGLAAAAVVVVAAASAVTWYALFAEDDRVRLTIEKPEGGTITAAGLVCGSRGTECSGLFDLESQVEFEATADEGFRLTGFTGDCGPGGRTRMTGPRSCGATFEKVPEAPAVPKYRLTVSKATGGTVVGSGINCGTRGDDCSVEYDVGTVITLTASADDGFTFRGFNRDCGTKREFSTAINRALDCGVIFQGRPLATAGGTTGANAGPATGPSAGGTGGRPTGTGTSGSSSGSTGVTPGGGGSGGPTGTDPGGETRAGGRTEKPEVVRPPKSDAEHAKEMEEQAKKDIEKSLAVFKDAMEALDANALQRIYPSVVVRTYQASFRSTESLQYSYGGPITFKAVDAGAGRATLEIDSKIVTKPKVGKPIEGEFTETFTMFKREDNWLILERQQPRPKKK